MGSSLRQWESDLLFSAAEVVQDSADRMDSIFRVLLHELCLAREHHPDPKFLRSIEYYRRDLATAIETAKWQLEDFEREANLSAKLDKSHARENVISRHRQFVRAIREQICDVEKTLRDTSADELVKGTVRVTLHEEDRNELALFLSGDSVSKHIPAKDFDDTNSMIRFLDPASSSNLDCEIVEHNSEENLHENSNNYFEASSCLQEAPYEMNNEIGSWDVEANKAASRSFFDETGSRVYNSRIKIFGSLPALWFTYGSRASRSFTKRWKDGEEQKRSQHHALQGNCRILSLSYMYIRLLALYSVLLTILLQSSRWISRSVVIFQRSRYYAQAKGYSMLLIPALILTLIVLGILLL